MKVQISRQLLERRRDLAALGENRATAHHQRQYLLRLSHEYQDITNLALDAHYARDEVFEENKELRLATITVARNDEFAEEMRLKGLGIPFKSPIADETEYDISNFNHSNETNLWRGFAQMSTSDQDELCYRFPELAELLQPESKLLGGSKDIMTWIEKGYRRPRGSELHGTINSTLLQALWKKQTVNWEHLTSQYIKNVLFSVHNFINKTLQHVCKEDHVREGLLSVLQDGLLSSYKTAIDRSKFIVEIDRKGSQLTQNHSLTDRLQKCRATRLASGLGSYLENSEVLRKSIDEQITTKKHKMTVTDKELSTAIEAIQNTILDSKKDDNIQDIHDILDSYYRVGRKRFVDTICMQATDYHLLTGPRSPLRVFDIEFVSTLSDGELDAVAGECLSTKERRATIEKEIDALEQGKKSLGVKL